MKWSCAHIPTLREKPQEAEVVSHQLMLRAAMMRKVASGIYSYMPLGWRVIRKMEDIIRQEMEAAGAQEVSLPVVQPKELWDETGRWSLYGKAMARVTDRHDNEFCLQPTSEEAVTDMLRRDLKSYRQLPMNLFQIQTKFRDEIRPRFGIMRGREFIMKDAYSFDIDEASARESYQQMQKAYRRIFTRTGLEFRPVEADTGDIGGNDSEEFMVLAASGEDEIISCSKCDYAANQEKATSKIELPAAGAAAEPHEFATPGLKTIEDLAKSLGKDRSDMMKTMIATDSKQKIIVTLVRGDHELNEVKLSALLSKELGMQGVRIARDDELEEWKLPKGSLGPYQFPKPHLVVVDDAINLEAAYVTGANKDGFHFGNVVLSRDCKVKLQSTIRNVTAGEACVRCGSALESYRGIEVGHVFYLGTKYSKAMSLKVANEQKSESLVEMGCYGIGVGRSVAACIEQNHDEFGIVWPRSLAPYELGIVSLDSGEASELAQKFYELFRSKGLDVIWDDRDLSPGVKMKDMELIGVPYQIVLGNRGLKNREFEWKIRKGNQKEMKALDQIEDVVMAAFRNEDAELQKKLEALV